MIPDTIGPSTEAVNLVTWGNYQFAVWYTLAGELRIGRIQRGVQRWGVDHDQYEFAGTPRTALSLPVTDDGHNIAAIAVDGLGKLHVWANMHSAPMRAVATTTAHTTNDWLATAGWADATTALPSTPADNTYPFPVHLPDGSLIFYLRHGSTLTGSGKADSSLWRRTTSGTVWTGPTMLFQGLSVPDAKGTGVAGDGDSVDSEFNWSSYPSGPLFVESPRAPHPGRLHSCWCWRIEALIERPNVGHSYGYSDDNGTTWKAINGTTLTLPITPINAKAARISGHARITQIARASNVVTATLDDTNHGILAGESCYVFVGLGSGYDGQFTISTVTGDTLTWPQTGINESTGLPTTCGWIGYVDYLNGQGITVDDDGHPHILASQSPTRYIRHDGTKWVQSSVATSINGIVHANASSAVWARGNMWMLKGAHKNVTGYRRSRLIKLTGGNASVVMGGEISPFGGHEPSYDPEAYRRFGTVEVLTCDGDRPRVYVYGAGSDRRAA